MADQDFTQQRQPNTSFASQYPYNQSIVYESGHFDEWDSTPGATRRRHGHKSGTYYEISDNGSEVRVTVNDHSTYVKGGMTHTVDGNYDLKAGGHTRFSFGKDIHFEIGANGALVMGGTGSVVCGGSLSFIAKENVTVICGKNASVKVGGNANVQISGDCSANVGGSVTAQIGKDLSANVGGSVTAQVGKDLSATVQGTLTANVSGKATIQSSSEVLIKSDNVQLGGEGGCGVVTDCGVSSKVFAII